MLLVPIGATPVLSTAMLDFFYDTVKAIQYTQVLVLVCLNVRHTVICNKRWDFQNCSFLL